MPWAVRTRVEADQVGWQVAAPRRRPDLLPNPRRPRSPRVRDRWDRMRPRVGLRRTWSLAQFEGARDPQAAIQDAWTAWARRVETSHGPGTVDLWVTADEPWDRRTVTAEYRPNTRRA